MRTRPAKGKPARGGERKLAAALERRRADRLAAAALLAPRRVDPSRSHVTVRDPEACTRACPDPCCTFLCPAAVFDWEEDGSTAGSGGPRLAIRYHLCVECGACRLFCDNIELDTPRGGYGILHRFG